MWDNTMVFAAWKITVCYFPSRHLTFYNIRGFIMLFSSILTQLSGFKVIAQDLQASHNYVIVDSAFPKCHALILRFVLVYTLLGI